MSTSPPADDCIGLIGVGLLGTALAERMLNAGYAICGFDVAAEDVHLILELADRVKEWLPLSTLHRRLLQRAVDMGYGDADNSAVIKVIEGWPMLDSQGPANA